MARPSSGDVKELTVTFQPPLYLERRGWIFEILRREDVHTVLDVGCGEGELISCLCNPAPWLPPPPTSVLDSLANCAGNTADACDNFHIAAALPEVYLHPTKVIGLDIAPNDLKYAIEGTAPRNSIRWSPLEVNIWQGSLESINPEFIGIECIVSTEVIEHLPDETLRDFAPVLLGAYHPRLLLITTPSYTFNTRFLPPDVPSSARNGFPDPTGRTTRIFRHHDHKFEWTVEEFRQWCQIVAEDWGYDVDVSGVGKPVEKDEWGRDEELGYASQVAAFRRREGQPHEEHRCAKLLAASVLQRTENRPKHKLLATHQHIAHERTHQPQALDEIGICVVDKMVYYQDTVMRVGELWSEDAISEQCGGWLDVLIKAVDVHPDLQLCSSHTKTLSNWEIVLKGRVFKEKVLWQEQTLDMQHNNNSPSSVGSFEELVTPDDGDHKGFEGVIWHDDPLRKITHGDEVTEPSLAPHDLVGNWDSWKSTTGGWDDSNASDTFNSIGGWGS
ncbi:uncharacterized protein FIBRA_06424 [Fibroporia radiculosa]|uniref:Small RNA 2'-O-methyltransferase n=1 Tax=Fibroporia radiculosa TaxID=599839 RepID=J4HZ32_9APHY|nr:uncharacterized protein FIBRA_06424 [Fibroporia radiculosa]CCM04257.1 predicted protein [Fibroporia radiculosa]